MESLSAANRIHCSLESADLLDKQKCQYPLKSRGLIDVKGRGEMVTYWVTGDWERTVRSGNRLGDELSTSAKAAPEAAPEVTSPKCTLPSTGKQSLRKVYLL